jgi:dTDP-4-dehydrorhamnose reductase
MAWETNVRGTENLVDACLKHKPDVYFIYTSTACVFDGEAGMYNEDSVPGPKNFYSFTKLVGEFAAKKIPNHLIIRTNFVAREKWPYPKAFTDRFGTYLFADDLARAIKDVVDSGQNGILHVTGEEKMSMFELAKITTPNVQPISLKEYHGPPLTMDMSLDTIRWKKYKITK